MDMEQISELDENDAPEGYRAVLSDYSCIGCAFDRDAKGCVAANTCWESHRYDGKNVVYVKREPISQWRPAAWVMPTDLPGINRAERIASLEMAAERVTPEPAKPATPAGLCVVAEQTHKLGGWGL